MKKYQAPHEKLTEDEIKSELEIILSKILKMINHFFYEDDSEFKKFINETQESIFKLRRHFCPEKTIIMEVTSSELADLMTEKENKNERTPNT